MRVMEKIGMGHDQLVRDQRVAPGVCVDVSYWTLSADAYFDAEYVMGEHCGDASETLIELSSLCLTLRCVLYAA